MCVGTPNPSPMPMSARPIVPVVPQDVPVASETTEQMIAAAARKMPGLRTCNP